MCAATDKITSDQFSSHEAK